MDAVKFIEEYKRMCNFFEYCYNCPLLYESCDNFEKINAEKAVQAVEEWSAANPPKTRQSEFLSHYPNAAVRDGVLALCPHAVEGKGYTNTGRCGYDDCADCRKAYWYKPIGERQKKHDDV